MNDFLHFTLGDATILIAILGYIIRSERFQARTEQRLNGHDRILNECPMLHQIHAALEKKKG